MIVNFDKEISELVLLDFFREWLLDIPDRGHIFEFINRHVTTFSYSGEVVIAYDVEYLMDNVRNASAFVQHAESMGGVFNIYGHWLPNSEVIPMVGDIIELHGLKLEILLWDIVNIHYPAENRFKCRVLEW